MGRIVPGLYSGLWFTVLKTVLSLVRVISVGFPDSFHLHTPCFSHPYANFYHKRRKERAVELSEGGELTSWGPFPKQKKSFTRNCKPYLSQQVRGISVFLGTWRSSIITPVSRDPRTANSSRTYFLNRYSFCFLMLGFSSRERVGLDLGVLFEDRVSLQSVLVLSTLFPSMAFVRRSVIRTKMNTIFSASKMPLSSRIKALRI